MISISSISDSHEKNISFYQIVKRKLKISRFFMPFPHYPTSSDFLKDEFGKVGSGSSMVAAAIPATPEEKKEV